MTKQTALITSSEDAEAYAEAERTQPAPRRSGSEQIEKLEQKVEALSTEVESLKKQFEEFRKQFE